MITAIQQIWQIFMSSYHMSVPHVGSKDRALIKTDNSLSSGDIKKYIP